VADFLINLAICAGAVAVLLGLVFAISVRRDRHDLIDVFWGLGFAVIAAVSLVLSPHPQVLVAVLTIAWGVRLAVYLAQGAIMLFVSLPVQAAQYLPAPPTWLVVLATVIWRKSRPEYAAYAQRTSGFFPLPPKATPRT
jgi:steroid 5-alpha reductase family enzyme